MYSKKMMTFVTLFMGLWILIGAAGARETEKGNPIDSGIVFYDGRYLEAPYRVECRDLAVFINGFRVTRPLEYPPYQEYLVDYDPGFPAGITRETSLEDGLDFRMPDGRHFDTVKQWYLFTHFTYEEAFEKTVQYYRSLPCVKSLMQDEYGGWVLEGYDGGKRLISFGGRTMRELNAFYGPGGGGPPSWEETAAQVEEYRQRYERRLLMGDCFLFFPVTKEFSFTQRKAANLLWESAQVLRSHELSDRQKQEELISLGLLPRGCPRLCERFVSRFQASPQLEERIRSLRAEVRDLFGPGALGPVVRDLDLRQKEQKNLNMYFGGGGGRGAAYSPDGLFLYGWCGYTFENAFKNFAQEIGAVGDYIKDQDYYVTTCIYTDDGGATGVYDDDCEECTYANYKGMAYADFLYQATHGLPSTSSVGGYIEMIRCKTSNYVFEWSGNDPLVDCLEYSSHTPHIFAAAGKTAWPTNYWSSMLTQSKAITILSCCYSHENGWTGACGGGVAFGYNKTCYGSNCEKNNKELLKRMNGQLDDAEYRKASEAYANMPAHLDEFSMVSSGAEITLCPAREEHEPEGVVAASGTGYFLVDTYCHDTVPADEALTFVTTGDVTIDNVQWVGSNEVNRIEFDWSGTGDFQVTVTANPDKFESWGAATGSFHRLDGNRVAPNADQFAWAFSHGCGLLLDADPYILSSEGGTVTFTLTSDASNGGRSYILLGSKSGTAPGVPLPGGMATLPLNPDGFTFFVLAGLNGPVFSNFMSTLDSSGCANAYMNTTGMGKVNPGCIGVTLNFAACLYDPYDLASNPVYVQIVP